MTNDEIIATKVMKYEYMSYISIPPIYWYKNGKYQVDVADYHPSKNLEQAFEALEKFGCVYKICKSEFGGYECSFSLKTGDLICAWETNLPEAICAALVEAVEKEWAALFKQNL